MAAPGRRRRRRRRREREHLDGARPVRGQILLQAVYGTRLLCRDGWLYVKRGEFFCVYPVKVQVPRNVPIFVMDGADYFVRRRHWDLQLQVGEGEPVQPCPDAAALLALPPVEVAPQAVDETPSGEHPVLGGAGVKRPVPVVVVIRGRQSYPPEVLLSGAGVEHLDEDPPVLKALFENIEQLTLKHAAWTLQFRRTCTNIVPSSSAVTAGKSPETFAFVSG